MAKRNAVIDGRNLMELDDLGLSLYETLRRGMPATQSRARVFLKGIVDVDPNQPRPKRQWVDYLPGQIGSGYWGDTPDHPNYRYGDELDGVPV